MTRKRAAKPKEPQYDVEAIRAKKIILGVWHYLIKWEGYDETENTWEPTKNLEGEPLAKEFERRLIAGELSEDEEDYVVDEVEAIREKKKIRGTMHYLVKWQGFPETENTWEPVQNLSKTDVAKDFERSWKEQAKRTKTIQPSPITGPKTPVRSIPEKIFQKTPAIQRGPPIARAQSQAQSRPEKSMQREPPRAPTTPTASGSAKKKTYGLQEGKLVSEVLGVIVHEDGVHVKLQYEDGSIEVVPSPVVADIAYKPLIAFYESKLTVTSRPQQQTG